MSTSPLKKVAPQTLPSSRREPLSLRRNSIWNVAGIGFYTFSQWAILVIIAKLSTPEMVGIFTLGLALTAPVMMLMRFNLRMAVVSDSEEEYSFHEYFTSRIITTVAFMILMVIVSFFYINEPYTLWVILLLSAARSVESIADLLHGRLQKVERLDLVAKSLIGKGVLTVVFFSLLMWVTKDLIISTIGMIISWVIVLICYDLKITRKYADVNYQWNKPNQKAIFLLTLPLGVALLVDSLVANVPRYMLEYFYGVEALGFYAAIFYIIHAGSNMAIAVSNAVIPQLSRDYHTFRLRSFVQLMTSLLLLLFGAGGVVVGLVYYYGEHVLTLLYTREYGDYNPLFFLLMIAGVIKYSGKFVETALFATRKFKVQPYINGVTLVVIMIFSMVWIPGFGAKGAAYALIIAEAIQFIVRSGILVYLLLRQRNLKKEVAV